jgi:hypothetical protein
MITVEARRLAKMKKVFLLWFVVCTSSQAQVLCPLQPEWQRVFGGDGWDQLFALEQTADGGYILGGFSSSQTNANKSGASYGFTDYWVVKVDGQGNRQWDRTFGGGRDDYMHALRQTSDGGYILAGWSSENSVGGTKTDTNQYGNLDFYLVRVDANGNQVWDRTFGGDGDDWLTSVGTTADGGFIVGGWSTSGISGNKTSPHGGPVYHRGYWVFRLDAAGTKLWDKSFGGDGDDWLESVSQTADGGFMVCGTSPELQLLRLDANGETLWQRVFDFQLVYSVRELPGGGYMLGGSYDSNDYPGTGGHGYVDYRLLRLDTNGMVIWRRAYGGSDADVLQFIEPMPDGGFLLGGSSQSDVSGSRTSRNCRYDPTDDDDDADIWIVRVDVEGNQLWDQAYGGCDADGLGALKRTSDGGFILGGWVSNAPTNYGGAFDFWTMKVAPEIVPATADTIKLCVVPQILREHGDEGYIFTLVGVSNRMHRIDYSTNFRGWIPLQSNYVGTGSVEIFDSETATNATRFYRAFLLP